MPSVLITGLRGFTGRFLAAELEASGHRVFGTVYGHEPCLLPGEYAVNLCNLEQVRNLVSEVKPDYVAHLAAVTFVAHDDADAMYRTNVVGTRNLLQALSESSKVPESILLTSSANIYGNAVVDPIDELTYPEPVNDYAISKLAMEYMARLWMDKLPLTIVRPFNYTGVGQSHNFLLPKIVSHFQRGERSIELGNIDISRDFSDVRMVASVYKCLLNGCYAGETFNVCSGVAASLVQILSMMADIAGYSISINVNPAFVRDNEIKILRGDNRKLLEAVGNIGTIPLRETLEWMYKEGQ
ncbi:GDP-6-deoxy-D-lyxo-4-hexulose reductase [Endozoicomonas montiporae]|uniref:GDP-6-deoxy-D-lyxo-4-hexulose reductase n=2 Tax=Endozoicomonas montiporae TaxID=1027273 RepID=A0A081NAL6_9GAMM|nr:GDP-mannose 4,6-dehydratase [Endozoicomonas montiporae]AMO56829.1 NAD-dependent epimerase/dehydratase [Endozoicomonas montiporae CL-33]KEQ15489.1 GDP-6-deoxy-D-lyxo-4-hexulose reductase [Endozoicomonas montiporae]